MLLVVQNPVLGGVTMWCLPQHIPHALLYQEGSHYIVTPPSGVEHMGYVLDKQTILTIRTGSCVVLLLVQNCCQSVLYPMSISATRVVFCSSSVLM